MTRPSSWREDDGFKYRLFPAKTEKPTSLIVYLHCLEGDTDLSYRYLHFLQSKIPGADVIAVQAPIKVIKSPRFPNPKGYMWFPFGGSILSQVETWLTHIFKRLTIAEQVEAFTKNQLEKRGLKEENLAYYGYSMGGIVALQTGLTGDKPVAAIVSRSSVVVPFTKVKSKSKVFLQMGELDDGFNKPATPLPKKGFLKQVFTAVANRLSLSHVNSVKRLQEQNVPVTEKVYPKQVHEQTYEAWKDAVDFMAKALAKPPSAPHAT
jgi:predicted esterase